MRREILFQLSALFHGAQLTWKIRPQSMRMHIKLQTLCYFVLTMAWGRYPIGTSFQIQQMFSQPVHVWQHPIVALQLRHLFSKENYKKFSL